MSLGKKHILTPKQMADETIEHYVIKLYNKAESYEFDQIAT